MYEVEVKAKLRDREEFVKKLESLGCKFSSELHQIDHIFIPNGIDFPPPLNTPVLRLRKQNNIFLFTLKISQTGRQDCIERELEISDGEKMTEILKFIKYKEVSMVDKKRIKTKLDDMEIVIDEVKELGEFIEVEKMVSNENGSERQEMQRGLVKFLEKLGVAKEDVLVNGKYDIMMIEKRQNK
jgi:adenylate cyclase class 2